MKWYSGDIASAISRCKADGGVLVVYINDTSDDSELMNEMWIDEEVSKIFDESLCVSLILSTGSIGGQQFSQIYPVSSVPSTYFISSSGQVLVTLNSCSKDDLKQAALSTLKKKQDVMVQSPQPQENIGAAASAIPDGAAAAAEINVTDTEAGIEAGDSAEQKEAKIERARELLKIKQQQKAEEEKEKARNAEIERRRLGKDMEELKRFKAEREAKETREALRKEKEQTRIAREKVKEQIQRDREARNAKYQQEKAEKEETLRKKQQEKLAKEAEEAARLAIANSSRARIQFRLPDGSTINHIFEADDLLEAARQVLYTHQSNTMGRNFRLAAVYPRKVFEDNDYKSSFRTLSLVPTSALLVLPPATGGYGIRPAPTSTGSITQLLSIIFTPILLLWQYISAFLFSRPPTQPAQGAGSHQPPSRSDNTQGGAGSPEDRTRRRVGRLSDLSPDGDEQNTWNGNSTQQM